MIEIFLLNYLYVVVIIVQFRISFLQPYIIIHNHNKRRIGHKVDHIKILDKVANEQ